MQLDPDTFRSILGRFASGVTVLTTAADGVDHGMTVTAFASLSLEPPLVLACIDRGTSMHHLLPRSRHFVVNVLASHQEALSRRFSDFDASRRFEGIGFTRAEQGAPILDDVLAWIECDLVAVHEGGDHGIFVGRVLRGETRDARPLLYYRGGYTELDR